MKKSPKKEEKKEIERLKQQLAEEQQKTQEYLTRLKYLQADFENYRRRIEKEVQENPLYCPQEGDT